jgi:hypothetical protein
LSNLALQHGKASGVAPGHLAVDAVLECFGLATPQNLKLLSNIFQHRRTADGKPDFAGSRLTGDGFPVEFATSHAETALRVTIEPGARTLSSTGRRALALRLVEEIDTAALAHLTAETLSHLEMAQGCAYGAWIGLRLGAARPAAKLYLEVPEAVSANALGLRMPQLARSNVCLRMLGYSSAGEEYYLRIPSLQREELAAVLNPAGLSDRAAPTLDMLEQLYGHRLDGRLPGPSVGVSYTVSASAPKVALYFFAHSLWGSDRRIRENFLALGGDLWKARAGYARATSPFMAREDWRTGHGLLAMVLQRDAPPRFAIGFRPSLS